MFSKNEHVFLYQMLTIIHDNYSQRQAIQPDLTGQIPEELDLVKNILTKLESSYGEIREERREEREGTEGICGEQENQAAAYFELFFKISQSIC